MNQQVQTSHVLEMREHPSLCFHGGLDSFLHPAIKLAYEGQIQSALMLACDLYVEHHGNMHHVSFRVVSTTKTVSMMESWKDFA